MREALTDCQLTVSIAMIKDTDKDTAKVQNGKAILYSKFCNQLLIPDRAVDQLNKTGRLHCLPDILRDPVTVE